MQVQVRIVTPEFSPVMSAELLENGSVLLEFGARCSVYLTEPEWVTLVDELDRCGEELACRTLTATIRETTDGR